jgi:predicted PurR-regulated permease PerM
LAALATIAILSGLELLVEPRLFNRRKNNSTMTVILMVVLVEDFGLVGLIMAPPITAALQIFFYHWLESAASGLPNKPAVEINQLQERFEKLVNSQTQNGESLPPALENLGNRLAKLLEEAGQLKPNS